MSRSLRLEPGHDLFGVHAQLDDLQGNPAFDWLLLLGHVNRAESSLANELQQLVTANHRAGAVLRWNGRSNGQGLSQGRLCQKASGCLVGRNETRPW